MRIHKIVCTYVVGMQQSQDVIFCGGPIKPLKAEMLVCKQEWLWGACRSVQSWLICLFDLILYIPSTVFQLYRDRSSWLNQYLGRNYVLVQGHNAVTPVKLGPVAPRSPVKHSTAEPLRSWFRLSCLLKLRRLVSLDSRACVLRDDLIGICSRL